jgi:hypothetical protein
MRLYMRVNGQMRSLDMEQAGTQTMMVGNHRYHLARLARRVRKLATRMWGPYLEPGVLENRFYFEAMEVFHPRMLRDDGGNFSPGEGAWVVLGKWNEDETVGIALHELAHEMHYRHGQGRYDASDWVVREALALMAERESGLDRTHIFTQEGTYHTAINLVAQLYQLRAFTRKPFHQRWAEMIELRFSTDLADIVNYYLDRSENLGLQRWLQRYHSQVEVREKLLQALSECSLYYSLEYRRILIRNLVRCSPDTTLERLFNILNSVTTLDERYPDHDLGEIIDFCFSQLPRTQRRLMASG